MRKAFIILAALVAGGALAQTVIGGYDQNGRVHSALVFDGGQQSVQVFGPPSYGTRTAITTGFTGYSVTAANFHSPNDGGTYVRADVLETLPSGNRVAVYLSNPDGTLQAPRYTTVTTSPRMTALGDFNEDGCLDFAVSNRTTTVGIYLGNCAGGFTAGTALTATGLTAGQGIVAARFGSSSHVSIAVGDRSGTNTDVFLGAGDGTFASAVQYTGVNGCYQMVTADLNNDRYTDLICTGTTTNNFGVFLGASDGTFGSINTFATAGTSPIAIALGDFNGDGFLDAALSTAVGVNGQLEVFYGAGANGGLFRLPSATFVNVLTGQGLAVGDINGDGFPDIVAVAQSFAAPGNGVIPWTNNGNGVFTTSGLLLLAANGTQPTVNGLYPALADINGDGLPEIFVANLVGAATIPSMWALYSTPIQQVAPALGAPYLVTPFPGAPLGSSPGPESQTTANCNSSYGTALGSLGVRRSVAIQPQFDATPVWVGGPKVTTCPGCPFSISDAGFSDGGPGIVGEEIMPGGYLSKDLSVASSALFCIKASGSEDGTFDGGWTVTTELP